MKYLRYLSPLLMLVLLAGIWGCERKVVVEGGDDDGNNVELTSCFGCHTDNNDVLRNATTQFANSVHSSGNNTDRNRLNSGFYQACERCHTSEGFIAYATGVPADGDHFTSFDCFTCHEPHTDGDLKPRLEDAVVLMDGTTYDRGASNLCASCHQSRRDVATTVVDGVELSSHWGPHHSNQADMLIGANAYEYSAYNYAGTDSWHQSGVTDGCVECHMSGSLHQTIGGHSWNMRNEERGFENIYGCNVAGCHLSDPVETVDRETVSDFDGDGETEGVQKEMEDLLEELAEHLVAANLLDEEHHPVSRTVATADSAGALYNYLFVEEDRSVGVHNTGYAVALMKSSINFLETGDPNGVAGEKLETLASH